MTANCMSRWLGFLIVAFSTVTSSAQTIDLALDLYYTDPANTASGGSWELVALSSDRGLAGLVPRLAGITDMNVFAAPNGSGTDVAEAGFPQSFGDSSFWFDLGDHTQFGFIQNPEDPADPPTPQGLFYDVGVPGGATAPGENGTPAIAGFVPNIGVPWNYDDLLGDFLADGDPGNDDGAFQDSVLLARGTFDLNSSPGFYADAASTGNVFMALGTAMDPPALGDIVEAAVTQQVRDNTGLLPGDANADGVVDVSDFNIWNGNKFTNTAGYRNGDFNADQTVDVSDFNLWNNNKFTSVVAAASVPEPSVWLLVLPALGGYLALCNRRCVFNRHLRESC